MDQRKGFFSFGRNVTVAGFVSFFMDISSEMIYPLVPLFMANVLGVNKSVIGIIEGIAESTASILKVFSGWLSDRLGNRKALMAAGYGISALSRVILAVATGWHHVMGFRLADRFGKGIRNAPRDAIIAESTDKTHLGKAFGFHRSLDTLGAVIGPGIAFIVLGIFANGYRIVFWLSLVPAATAVLLIIFFIVEKKKSPEHASQIPKLTFRHFDGKFRIFVVISTIFALGNSSDVFLILRAQQEGIPVATIPVVYLVFNLIYAMAALPAGIAADRFGRKRLILLGFILFAVTYYGFAIAEGSLIIWLLFSFYGLFMGLTDGVQRAFLATIIPADFKATAFGIYNTAVGLAMLPASMIGGLLWDNISPAATFYYGAITAAISAILFMIFIFAGRNQKVRSSSA